MSYPAPSPRIESAAGEPEAPGQKRPQRRGRQLTRGIDETQQPQTEEAIGQALQAELPAHESRQSEHLDEQEQRHRPRHQSQSPVHRQRRGEYQRRQQRQIQKQKVHNERLPEELCR